MTLEQYFLNTMPYHQKTVLALQTDLQRAKRDNQLLIQENNMLHDQANKHREFEEIVKSLLPDIEAFGQLDYVAKTLRSKLDG